MRPIVKILGGRLAKRRNDIHAIDECRAREALSCYSFMGCTSQSGVRDLLENLRESYAAARSFAESSDFRLAMARLRKTGPEWEPAQNFPNHCILLVANCSLRALSLIAGAKIKGWHLVVEDCPFSRNFIAPVSARCQSEVEFQPGHLLPARLREIMQTEGHGLVLFVTFCDRPVRKTDEGIETEVAGGRYYFSVVDALLMVAAFNKVFVLGSELRQIAVAHHTDWATGLISGETLFHYTSLCSEALSDVIATTPGQYIGVTQLVTRGTKYRVMTERNKKSLVKSLLHYCQISGMPILEQSYNRLLHKLDAPDPARAVESHLP